MVLIIRWRLASSPTALRAFITARVRADGPGQGGLGDEHAGPDRVLQFVLVYCTVAVLNEVDQQIEHARLDLDLVVAAPQLTPRHVDREAAEAVESVFWLSLQCSAAAR
jgi:hypothetical protein